MTYTARAFFLVASLALAAASVRAAQPRLVVSQLGLHLICTADGQPDMYSWRIPSLDTSSSARPGDFPRGALWLQGAQSLIRLDAQTQTLGAKTLSGVMNNLEVFWTDSGLQTELENLSLKGVLDLPATALSRKKGEGIDAALQRLRIEFQSQGMIEIAE
ncbi:hypothetical protein [Prosthecobacter dejongeii]|uniref:Uncharacterized protein n=1 Tax=Prosthecobacter dejongeii TaxID=48465 RepID=A0A7W8DQ54_9BACT|nr:hypothetical protein [Prosthecobacter dejongeii]MBB5037997.1 hypothetical protein [Prosthecobacter dejongeii]